MCPFLFQRWTFLDWEDTMTSWAVLVIGDFLYSGQRRPPCFSKMSKYHNWTSALVSCWKSRFCTDLRPVAVCNHVHTQLGFKYSWGKGRGLKWILFQGFFAGEKMAAWVRICTTTNEWFELLQYGLADQTQKTLIFILSLCNTLLYRISRISMMNLLLKSRALCI